MSGSLFGNIIGTLYVLAFQSTGILLMYHILKKENIFIRLLLGSVSGSILLHWCPVICSFVVGFNWISHLLALLFVLFIYIYGFRKRMEMVYDPKSFRVKVRSHGAFVIVSVGLFVLWSYLLYSHTLLPGEYGGLYTGQSTYGDMNMHLAFITGIAKQGTFPPEYSLFPGRKLAYPFLSASISSSVYVFGASLRYAYILPMLIAFLQILGSVYLLAYTVLRSRKKALLAYLLFFLNGGLGFIYFVDWNKNTNLTVKDIFTGFYTTPTNLVDYNIRWVNVIADMLLPQRATLFGYALLFPAIWLLHQAVFAGKRKYFLIAGIFVGALPMIHTHSFLGMGLVSGAWLLTDLYRSVKSETDKRWKGGLTLSLFVISMCILQVWNQKGLSSKVLFALGCVLLIGCVGYGFYLLILLVSRGKATELLCGWGLYLVSVLVPALPQLLFWTFGQVAEGGFLRGHFNWGNQGEFYPWFYVKNLGIISFLIIGAICTGRKKVRHLMLPVFIIWSISELIVFTPNTYDNNKLLYIGYLFLCLIAADYAVELYRRIQGMEGRRLLAGVTLFLTFISAGLTLGREVVSQYQLYDAVQIELVNYIEEHTEASDVFLTDTRHNNEVVSLAGRNIVCGADAFLYFHGIDTTQRKQDIKAMYEDPLNNKALFEQYHVAYAVISPWGRSAYQVDEALWAQEYELVFSYQGTYLYKIE